MLSSQPCKLSVTGEDLMGSLGAEVRAAYVLAGWRQLPPVLRDQLLSPFCIRPLCVSSDLLLRLPLSSVGSCSNV